jgi:hypothetical protein
MTTLASTAPLVAEFAGVVVLTMGAVSPGGTTFAVTEVVDRQAVVGSGVS